MSGPMILHWSPRSPYVRKVMIAAHEMGLTDRIVTVRTIVGGTTPHAELMTLNPLGKIPALVLDDGAVLFDSRVIVEYLDHSSGGGLMPPASDPERWQTLRLQTVADGILDAALLMRYEVALRPDRFLWREWLDGQGRKVQRALATLEAEVLRLEQGAALNGIAAACALGYLDFRFEELDWRTRCPSLALFFQHYSERPEMVWTDPRAV